MKVLNIVKAIIRALIYKVVILLAYAYDSLHDSYEHALSILLSQ